MMCEDCGTVYYSAAARTMVQRGERCANCGGRLQLADGPRPVRSVGGEGGPQRGRRMPRDGDDAP